MPTPKVLFVLADGAHARFVERSHETGHHVTILEMSGHHGSEHDRDAKEAFVTQVAARAARLAAERADQGVFIAAPARLLPVLRESLAGKVTITGEIDRDLAKTPDAELAQFLPAQPMSPAGV